MKLAFIIITGSFPIKSLYIRKSYEQNKAFLFLLQLYFIEKRVQ